MTNLSVLQNNLQLGKLSVFFDAIKNGLTFKIMINSLILLINNINICGSNTLAIFAAYSS